jgi:hypothetical protein
MQSKPTWPSMLGLGILSLTVLSLLVSTLIEAWVYHYLGGIISVLVLLGAIIAIFHEAKQLAKNRGSGYSADWIFQGLAVITGGLAAYALAHEVSLGPVIAASLVGLFSSLIWPETSIAAYCGAFVGMTSEFLLFNYLEVALAGLIAGVVFVLAINVFNGFGGKLGTIALVGTALTSMSLNREFIILPIADWQTNALIMVVAMVATPLTFFFNIARKHGPVLASAIVGITAGLILPVLDPQLGPTLAVVAICASFAGMTSKARCSNFWHILITGFFSGVIFVCSTPLLGGAGGKLGTIAFGAVLGTCGLIKLINQMLVLQRSENGNQGA